MAKLSLISASSALVRSTSAAVAGWRGSRCRSCKANLDEHGWEPIAAGYSAPSTTTTPAYRAGRGTAVRVVARPPTQPRGRGRPLARVLGCGRSQSRRGTPANLSLGHPPIACFAVLLPHPSSAYQLACSLVVGVGGFECGACDFADGFFRFHPPFGILVEASAASTRPCSNL